MHELLNLENPAVGISFLDTPPQGVKKNEESVPSGCVFWINGFKDNFYTDKKDHANCNIGSFTHGFLAPQDVSLDACMDIALFDKTGYFPASEFGGVPRMAEAPNYVAYGPLSKIAFEPDVVLVVCNPEQGMIMGESTTSAKLRSGLITRSATTISFRVATCLTIRRTRWEVASHFQASGQQTTTLIRICCSPRRTSFHQAGPTKRVSPTTVS